MIFKKVKYLCKWLFMEMQMNTFHSCQKKECLDYKFLLIFEPRIEN